MTIAFVNACDVKFALCCRSNGCMRKYSCHRRQRVRPENGWVDRGVVFENVPFYLVEDNVAPDRHEAIKGGDGEEKVA